MNIFVLLLWSCVALVANCGELSFPGEPPKDSVLVSCNNCGISESDLKNSFNKRPETCDNELYCTSESQRNYERGNIDELLKEKFTDFEQLYENVVTHKRPAIGRFPRQIKDKESCDYTVDFPIVTHVQTFPYGWAPMVQEFGYRQYFRLETCTKSDCNKPCSSDSCTPLTNCRTVSNRHRVLVWQGDAIVSAFALLPDSCKCVKRTFEEIATPEPESEPKQDQPPSQYQPPPVITTKELMAEPTIPIATYETIKKVVVATPSIPIAVREEHPVPMKSPLSLRKYFREQPKSERSLPPLSLTKYFPPQPKLSEMTSTRTFISYLQTTVPPKLDILEPYSAHQEQPKHERSLPPLSLTKYFPQQPKLDERPSTKSLVSYQQTTMPPKLDVLEPYSADRKHVNINKPFVILPVTPKMNIPWAPRAETIRPFQTYVQPKPMIQLKTPPTSVLSPYKKIESADVVKELPTRPTTPKPATYELVTSKTTPKLLDTYGQPKPTLQRQLPPMVLSQYKNSQIQPAPVMKQMPTKPPMLQPATYGMVTSKTTPKLLDSYGEQKPMLQRQMPPTNVLEQYKKIEPADMMKQMPTKPTTPKPATYGLMTTKTIVKLLDTYGQPKPMPQRQLPPTMVLSQYKKPQIQSAPVKPMLQRQLPPTNVLSQYKKPQIQSPPVIKQMSTKPPLLQPYRVLTRKFVPPKQNAPLIQAPLNVPLSLTKYFRQQPKLFESPATKPNLSYLQTTMPPKLDIILEPYSAHREQPKPEIYSPPLSLTKYFPQQPKLAEMPSTRSLVSYQQTTMPPKLDVLEPYSANRNRVNINKPILPVAPKMNISWAPRAESVRPLNTYGQPKPVIQLKTPPTSVLSPYKKIESADVVKEVPTTPKPATYGLVTSKTTQKLLDTYGQPKPMIQRQMPPKPMVQRQMPPTAVLSQYNKPQPDMMKQMPTKPVTPQPATYGLMTTKTTVKLLDTYGRQPKPILHRQVPPMNVLGQYKQIDSADMMKETPIKPTTPKPATYGLVTSKTTQKLLDTYGQPKPPMLQRQMPPTNVLSQYKKPQIQSAPMKPMLQRQLPPTNVLSQYKKPQMQPAPVMKQMPTNPTTPKPATYGLMTTVKLLDTYGQPKPIPQRQMSSTNVLSQYKKPQIQSPPVMKQMPTKPPMLQPYGLETRKFVAPKQKVPVIQAPLKSPLSLTKYFRQQPKDFERPFTTKPNLSSYLQPTMPPKLTDVVLEPYSANIKSDATSDPCAIPSVPLQS